MQIHWESILTINKLQWQDTDFVLSGQLSKLTEVDKSWSSSKKQSPKALVMDIRMAWMRFFQGAPYSQKWDLPGCCFLEISPQIIRRMSTAAIVTLTTWAIKGQKARGKLRVGPRTSSAYYVAVKHHNPTFHNPWSFQIWAKFQQKVEGGIVCIMNTPSFFVEDFPQPVLTYHIYTVRPSVVSFWSGQYPNMSHK